VSSLQQIDQLIAPGAGLKRSEIVLEHHQRDDESYNSSVAISNGDHVVRVYGSEQVM
jgi:hypothetical protein